jgi:signal transduction histidine kinase
VKHELDAAPTPLVADADRVMQVLTNLLENALRHAGNPGRIRVTVATRADGPTFCVHDEGPGIDPAHHEAIFERFRQLDARGGRRADGAGLGLAIARQIVQQHGGRIWVESAPGEGASFCFTLPVPEPDD